MTQANVYEFSQALVSRKVNELANITAQIKALQERAADLKTDFRGLGLGLWESADHSVSVIERSRITLDTALVKSILTPAQIIEVSRVSLYIEVCVA